MERTIRNDKYTFRLNLLWIGLGLFMFGYAQPDIILFTGLGSLLNRVTQLGGVLIYFALFSSLAPKAEPRTQWVKALILSLLVWHLFMLVNGTDLLNYIYYFDPYCYSAYLYVLLLLVPVLPLLRSFFSTSRWLMLMALPLGVLPLMYYESFGAIQCIFEGFIFGAALLVMTNKYHSKQWVLAAWGVLLFGLLVSAITARRNLMVTDFLYMAGGAYMTLFKGNKIPRTTIIFALLSLISLALLGIGFFLLNSKGMFANLVARAGENTREYVVLYFFWDMIQTPFDMLIGRGIRGAYECVGVEDGGYDNLRQNVENGYLQLMLKGGIIYILLYLTTFFTAMRRALKSRNQLCQATLIILAIQLIDMLFFGLHAVNLKTFMIWMCVSAVLSKPIQQMDDQEMLDALTEKRHRLPQWKEAPNDSPKP